MTFRDVFSKIDAGSYVVTDAEYGNLNYSSDQIRKMETTRQQRFMNDCLSAAENFLGSAHFQISKAFALADRYGGDMYETLSLFKSICELRK